MAEPLTFWIEDGPNVSAKVWAARILARIAGFPFIVRVIPYDVAPGRGPAVYYGSLFTPDAIVIRPSGYFSADPSMPSLVPLRPSGELDGSPVLFGEGGWRLDQVASVTTADVLASAFYLASRVEERAIRDRDGHARMPATASFLGRNGLLGRPLVDEYAIALANQVHRLWPDMKQERPWPHQDQLAICVSHDIETLACPTRLGYMRHKQRVAIRHLMKGAVSDAVRSVGAGVVRGITGHNPSWSFDRLRFAIDPLPDTFYFFGGATSPRDGQYDAASSEISTVLRSLYGGGCEVGVHLGYETGLDAARIASQKETVENALGAEVRGARYHYLRCMFPDASKACAKAGLKYDASLGFADQPGFRGATSYPYCPFDFDTNKPLDIFEVPLVAMDGTFFQYQGLSADQTVSSVLSLVETVRRSGGVFTLLWHNTTVDPVDHPGPSQAYERIAGALKTMPAWASTNYGCVEQWRRYCRSLEVPSDQV